MHMAAKAEKLLPEPRKSRERIGRVFFCKLEVRLVRRPRVTGDLTSRTNQTTPKRATA
jgi:hypothetical protein